MGTPGQMSSKRDQLGRRIAPGIWQDVEGNPHFSIPELLALVGLPDTPEHHDRLKASLRELLASEMPEAKIVERDHPDVPFTISHDGRSITCGRCGRTSWNRNDVEQHYCCFCHVFHDEP